MFTNHIYLIFRNKSDLALNKQQWLICHKTKPNLNTYLLDSGEGFHRIL